MVRHCVGYLLCVLVTIIHGQLYTMPALWSTTLMASIGSIVDMQPNPRRAGGARNVWWIVSQTGYIYEAVEGQTGPFTTVVDISASLGIVRFGKEEGLLGMTFAPDFVTSNTIYITIVVADPTVGAALPYLVQIHRLSGADNYKLGAPLLKWGISNAMHPGGWLGFRPPFGVSSSNIQDLHELYISTGDGGPANDSTGQAQLTTSLRGKMLRILVSSVPNSNYTIPADNMYAASTSKNKKKEIYALGLRHPWRCSFDVGDVNASMICGDVGQDAIDPVRKVDLGSNHGWRPWEGSRCNYAAECGVGSTASFTKPIFDGCHSDYTTPDSVAICGAREVKAKSLIGGFIYRGKSNPAMTGHYIFSDYVLKQVTGLYRNINGAYTSYIILDDTDIAPAPFPAVSSLAQDLDGEVYLIGYADSSAGGIGQIYKVPCGRLCGPVTLLPTATPTLEVNTLSPASPENTAPPLQFTLPLLPVQGTTTIQAEYFLDVEGVGYYHIEGRSPPATVLRDTSMTILQLPSTGTDADIASIDYVVAFTSASEWMRYELIVETAGDYTASFNIGGGDDDSVDIYGVSLLLDTPIPSDPSLLCSSAAATDKVAAWSGNIADSQIVTVESLSHFTLTSGVHMMTLCVDAGSPIIDSYTLTLQDNSGPPLDTNLELNLEQQELATTISAGVQTTSTGGGFSGALLYGLVGGGCVVMLLGMLIYKYTKRRQLLIDARVDIVRKRLVYGDAGEHEPLTPSAKRRSCRVFGASMAEAVKYVTSQKKVKEAGAKTQPHSPNEHC